MTDRNPDIHCEKCGRYMHSIYPRDPMPEHPACEQCEQRTPRDDDGEKEYTP